MENGESSCRRFLQGDKSTFDEILKEYRQSLTFFIYRYVKNYDEAEDIAIDVFVEFLAHPKKYNFKTSLKTYLFMIGRCRALDYLRHNKKFIHTGLDEADTVLSDESSLPENFIIAERNKQLNDAVSRLPDDMKAAVHLVYFEGLSYEETGKVMKKSKKQVDNLLYRAKGKLKISLSEKGVEL